MRPTPEEIRRHYVGIESTGLAFNPVGWNSENAACEEAIKAVKPTVIIEAGVYLGRSVIHTLKMAAKHGLNPVLYAVDTWHGPAGHPIGHIPSWPTTPAWNGPTQFQQFLYNIKLAGFDSQVIPIQEFTAWGARILRAWDVKAQTVFIDGDHSRDGSYADMINYWPLLEVGGRMRGDDLHYRGVWQSAGRFAEEVGHDVRSECGQWVIDKLHE